MDDVDPWMNDPLDDDGAGFWFDREPGYMESLRRKHGWHTEDEDDAETVADESAGAAAPDRGDPVRDVA